MSSYSRVLWIGSQADRPRRFAGEDVLSYMTMPPSTGITCPVT